MNKKVIMMAVISAIEFEVDLTILISLKNIIINHNSYSAHLNINYLRI